MLVRFATSLSPSLERFFRSTADRVCAKLGCRTELVVGTSFGQITAGEVDFAFTCGYPDVELARGDVPPHAIAAPVLAGDRYEGRPVYYPDVIVRRDDPISTFAELTLPSWELRPGRTLVRRTSGPKGGGSA